MNQGDESHQSESRKWLFCLPWSLSYPGGVNQVVLNLAGRLADASDYRPVALSNQWDAPRLVADPDDSRFSGFAAWHGRLRAPPESWRGLKALLAYLLWIPGAVYRLSRFLIDQRVSVINIHYPTIASFIWVPVKRIGGRRWQLVLSFHGRDLRGIVRTEGLHRRLWNMLIHSADHIVPCSNAMAREFASAYPALTDRVTVVQNGTAYSYIEALAKRGRTQRRPKDGAVHLVAVGTFEHKKGHDVLLKALAILKERTRSGIRLTLIGRSGPLLAGLRELTASLDIEPVVEFVCDIKHEEVIPRVVEADIFVMPSRHEGLPLAILEAGVCAMPVVASAVSGIPEIIRDGEHGLLVPPDDPCALADAIEKMINDPVLAGALGSALQARIKDQFTWESVCAKYLALTDASVEHG